MTGVSKGCRTCKVAVSKSGTCHLCGRQWGECATNGVHPDSPCPNANRHVISGNPHRGAVCRHCGQSISMQDTSTPEEVSGEGLDEAGLDDLTPIQALRASFLQIALQHNQTGLQLKSMQEVIKALEREETIRSIVPPIPPQPKVMTQAEFQKLKRDRKRERQEAKGAKRRERREAKLPGKDHPNLRAGALHRSLPHPCCENISLPRLEGWQCEMCGRTWVEANA